MWSHPGRRAVARLLGAVLITTLAACGGPDSVATPTTGSPGSTSSGTPTPIMSGVPATTPEPAFDAESYFRGRVINLMVGFAPGGGTDATARFFAKEFPRFIPGEPRMVVTNMTPNITERNFVWNAEPDGFTLALETVSGIAESRTPEAEYVSAEMTFIGASSVGEMALVIRGDVPYESLAGAIGSDGPTLILADRAPSPADVEASLLMIGYLALRLDLPLEVRSVANTGTSNQLLYIERNEANLWQAGDVWFSLPRLRPNWVTDGFVRPFADLALPGRRTPANSEGPFDAPHVSELLDPADIPLWETLSGTRTFIAKHIVGPPNMDAHVTKALRDAFRAAMADSQFRTDLETFTGLPVEPVYGEEGQQALVDWSRRFEESFESINNVQAEVFERFVQ